MSSGEGKVRVVPQYERTDVREGRVTVVPPTSRVRVLGATGMTSEVTGTSPEINRLQREAVQEIAAAVRKRWSIGTDRGWPDRGLRRSEVGYIAFALGVSRETVANLGFIPGSHSRDEAGEAQFGTWVLRVGSDRTTGRQLIYSPFSGVVPVPEGATVTYETLELPPVDDTFTERLERLGPLMDPSQGDCGPVAAAALAVASGHDITVILKDPAAFVRAHDEVTSGRDIPAPIDWAAYYTS